VHELAHLLVPGHGPDFWLEVDRYPRTERARGYLEGVSATAGLGLSDDLPDEDLPDQGLPDKDLPEEDLPDETLGIGG